MIPGGINTDRVFGTHKVKTRRREPAGFLFGLVKSLSRPRNHLSCGTVGTLNHLNCGTVGTVMRGGAIGAAPEAFALPLGSTDMLSNALILAAFDRAPPTLLNVPFQPSLRRAQMKRQAKPRARRGRRLLARCLTWGSSTKIH